MGQVGLKGGDESEHDRSTDRESVVGIRLLVSVEHRWYLRFIHPVTAIEVVDCGDGDEEHDAGELAQWLHHNEPSVNKEYSQKLAGRTIDALLDLTKGRLYVKRKNRRKDGLSYEERRVVLPEESEIPGETTFETSDPETADVSSE